MTYRQTYKGTLHYAEPAALEAALDAFASSADETFDVSALEISPLAVKLDYDIDAPASWADRVMNSLHVLARFAKKGQIRCTFTIDSTSRETIVAGKEAVPPRERHRRWELYAAVSAGDAAAVAALLADRVEAPAGQDLLKLAASSGHAEIVDQLGAAGHRSAEAVGVARTPAIAQALVMAGNPPTAEALHESFRHDNGPLSLLLFRAGARLDEKDMRWGLFRLCLFGARDELHEMLRIEPALRAMLITADVAGGAVKGGHIALFDDLIAMGATLPERYPSKAAEECSPEFMAHLMKHPGAPAECGPSNDTGDAMCRAALNGRLGTMQAMAAAGVPIHPAVPGKTFPLDMAVSGSRSTPECVDVIRWLRAQGVPADAKNANGEKAIGGSKAARAALKGG